jgi:hypothetical protein
MGIPRLLIRVTACDPKAPQLPWTVLHSVTPELARPDLFLDVCGLRFAQVEGLLGCETWHRLQLRIRKREAQQAADEAVDEEQRGNVAAGQQVEEGPKAVAQQEDADRRQNRPERDLRGQPQLAWLQFQEGVVGRLRTNRE